MKAVELVAGLRVEILDNSEFLKLEREWNELVEETENEPFYRHEFIRVWINNFAPNARLRILTGRDCTGRLTAVLPLIEENSFFLGFPVKQLVSTSNIHSCRFDMIAKDKKTAGQEFFWHLSMNKSWDLIKIMDVPEGGNAWSLFDAARSNGFPTGVWESQQNPYIPLPDSYEKLIKDTGSKNLKGNLRKRRNRMKALGEITVERITDRESLDHFLKRGYEIEKSGWKGRKGTAIAQDKQTIGFYTDLAHASAERNYLSLFFLKLNSRPIAFHFGLTYGGIHSVPKIGYDENFQGCSPGLILLEEVLKDCIQRGLKKFDFLGPNMDWKRQWSEKVRHHNWLFLFRNNKFGQALCKAKFKWIPATKHFLFGREENHKDTKSTKALH